MRSHPKSDHFSDEFVENLKNSNVKELERDFKDHPTALLLPEFLEISASSSLESFKFMVETVKYSPYGNEEVGNLIVKSGDLDRLGSWAIGCSAT